MKNRHKDTSRHTAKDEGVIGLHTIAGMEGINYDHSVMRNGNIKQEYALNPFSGDLEFDEQNKITGASIASNPPLYRVFADTRHEENEDDKILIVAYPVTDIDDDPTITSLKVFLEQNYEERMRNHRVFIPIAQQRHFNRPFSFIQRFHFVTLCIEPDEDGNLKAILYDSKSRFFSGLYDLSMERKIIKETLNIDLEVVYLGKQSLFNEYDCGPWSNRIIRALIDDIDPHDTEVTLDRPEQVAAYDLHFGQDAYDNNHEQTKGFFELSKKANDNLQVVLQAVFVCLLAAVFLTPVVAIAALIVFGAVKLVANMVKQKKVDSQRDEKNDEDEDDVVVLGDDEEPDPDEVGSSSANIASHFDPPTSASKYWMRQKSPAKSSITTDVAASRQMLRK